MILDLSSPGAFIHKHVHPLSTRELFNRKDDKIQCNACKNVRLRKIKDRMRKVGANHSISPTKQYDLGAKINLKINKIIIVAHK